MQMRSVLWCAVMALIGLLCGACGHQKVAVQPDEPGKLEGVVDVYAQAMQHLSQGRVEQSLPLLEEAAWKVARDERLEEQVHGDVLFYHLGGAYYKLEFWEEAMAAYLKATTYLSWPALATDLRKNEKLLAQKLGYQGGSYRGHRLAFWHPVVGVLSLSAWLWLCVLVSALALVGLTLKKVRVVGVLLLFGSSILGLCAFESYRTWRGIMHAGVVCCEDTFLLSSPYKNLAVPLYKLPRGTIAELRSRQPVEADAQSFVRVQVYDFPYRNRDADASAHKKGEEGMFPLKGWIVQKRLHSFSLDRLTASIPAPQPLSRDDGQ